MEIEMGMGEMERESGSMRWIAGEAFLPSSKGGMGLDKLGRISLHHSTTTGYGVPPALLSVSHAPSKHNFLAGRNRGLRKGGNGRLVPLIGRDTSVRYMTCYWPGFN